MLQLLYGQFVRRRRRYLERRPDLRRRLAAPVISVGNLTIGGSGKTPLVAEIARLLIEMGERPSILSRGYARTAPVDGVVVASDGHQIRSDVAHAGDEPYMLALAVPGAAVVVNASRYLAGRVAESQLGCTVHLLDDGFQHLRLARDVDLLVAPPEDFTHARTLPFGRLREPVEAARAADALLVPVSDISDSTDPRRMSERLRVPTAFGFTRRVSPPTSTTPAFAFAAIAKPQDFFSELERVGWVLVGHRAFRDHHNYSATELGSLQRDARTSGAETLVTTEKDAVRLAAGAFRMPLTAVPLHVSIDPAFGPWLQARLARARAA